MGEEETERDHAASGLVAVVGTFGTTAIHFVVLILIPGSEIHAGKERVSLDFPLNVI